MTDNAKAAIVEKLRKPIEAMAEDLRLDAIKDYRSAREGIECNIAFLEGRESEYSRSVNAHAYLQGATLKVALRTQMLHILNPPSGFTADRVAQNLLENYYQRDKFGELNNVPKIQHFMDTHKADLAALASRGAATDAAPKRKGWFGGRGG